jgi:hypothetical protein
VFPALLRETLRSAICSAFDMTIVPEAANMPPMTPQTESWRRGFGRGGAGHLAHAFLQCVHAGMHVGTAAAIGVQGGPRAGGPADRSRGAGAVLRAAMKALDSLRGTKAKILEAVVRQMRKACPGSEQGAS